MNNIFVDYDGTRWEKFCEIMMRHYYTQQFFTSVPAGDRGDCGLEFFTKDGSIFQCYCPDSQYSMAEYKKHVQTKIREDLKKLKKYENEIEILLDGIVIKQWVLLLPENKSKELIKYCNTHKNNVKKQNVSYINNNLFDVKIETADSYPSSKIHALRYSQDHIHIPFKDVLESDLDNFKQSTFEENIHRKSNIISPKPVVFSNSMIKKYLKMVTYLDDLRYNYPDTFQEVEECGRMLLSCMQELVEIEGMNTDIDFIKKVKEKNEIEINNIFHNVISRNNLSELSYGFISKWIAECYMDFQ